MHCSVKVGKAVKGEFTRPLLNFLMKGRASVWTSFYDDRHQSPSPVATSQTHKVERGIESIGKRRLPKPRPDVPRLAGLDPQHRGDRGPVIRILDRRQSTEVPTPRQRDPPSPALPPSKTPRRNAPPPQPRPRDRQRTPRPRTGTPYSNPPVASTPAARSAEPKNGDVTPLPEAHRPHVSRGRTDPRTSAPVKRARAPA